MSSMFAAEVVQVTPDCAVMKLRSVHPDSGPPMPTATFALRLMYDPIIQSGCSEFEEYHHIESSPLAQAMDRDDYLVESWIEENARAFVTRASLVGQALTIWPTHPGWTQHLRVGMAWETAAYSTGPGLSVAKRAPAAAGAVSARTADPNAGFRVGKPKMPDCPLKRASIALHGPNRYVADPVITDPAAMATAARTMIGEPVIVVPRRGPNVIGTIVKLHGDGMMLYAEAPWGLGWQLHRYEKLRSMGRAWLKHTAGQTDGEGAMEKAPKPTANKVQKATANKVPKSTANKVPRATANKVPRATAKKLPKASAKKLPKASAKKLPKATAKKLPKASAKKLPKATAKKLPKATTKKLSKATAKKV